MGDVTYFVCNERKQLRSYVNVPIGHPLYNTIIYILDADKKPAKVGEIGELYVAGLNLAHAYVNGRDKDRFIDNFMAVDPSKKAFFLCCMMFSLIESSIANAR